MAMYCIYGGECTGCMECQSGEERFECCSCGCDIDKLDRYYVRYVGYEQKLYCQDCFDDEFLNFGAGVCDCCGKADEEYYDVDGEIYCVDCAEEKFMEEN